MLLGDHVLEDWRDRTKRASARVRGYYDVHPDIESKLTLDPSNRNRYGDPMPTIEQRFDASTVGREDRVRRHLLGLFERLARANNGKVLTENWGGMLLDHPGGGCRMGTDPTESVCDSYGRTHDHENLFVVGAPTIPTAGCTNGTLTFVALTLRSAPKIAAVLS
jgi:quinoprotein glucose dehydrogenase